MNKLRLATATLLLSAAQLVHAQAPAEPAPAGDAPTVSNPTDTHSALPMPSAEPAGPTAPLDGAPADNVAPVAGEGALSAEELEELGFGGGSPAIDTDLKVSGFADLNFVYMPMPKQDPWRAVVQNHSSFFVGNFNLYLTKNLSENVRTFAEVRFHYAPHGSADLTGDYTVNAAPDTADLARPVHLGGVEIERIYLEWAIHPRVSVRVGQFLTPYGVWNVDHGSPIYIPTTRPYVIGSQLFPERQTGLEFFGRWDAGDSNAIGYHLTLSNGLGPVSEVRDLDENKGVGGRLYWENRALGTLKVGGSAFYAQDTAASPAPALNMGKLSFGERIDSQSKVLALAADLQWHYSGVIAQAELVTQQRTYVDGGRPSGVNNFAGGKSIFALDYITWGAYGLLGYSFDLWSVNMLPYFLVSSFDEFTSTAFTVTKTNGFTAGWNVRPIDSVVCKLAFGYSKFPDGHVLGYGPVRAIQTQIAWAF